MSDEKANVNLSRGNFNVHVINMNTFSTNRFEIELERKGTIVHKFSIDYTDDIEFAQKFYDHLRANNIKANLKSCILTIISYKVFYHFQILPMNLNIAESLNVITDDLKDNISQNYQEETFRKHSFFLFPINRVNITSTLIKDESLKKITKTLSGVHLKVNDVRFADEYITKYVDKQYNNFVYFASFKDYGILLFYMRKNVVKSILINKQNAIYPERICDYLLTYSFNNPNKDIKNIFITNDSELLEKFKNKKGISFYKFEYKPLLEKPYKAKSIFEKLSKGFKRQFCTFERQAKIKPDSKKSFFSGVYKDSKNKKNSKSKKKANKGFTLVETVVALAVFSISAAGLITAFLFASTKIKEQNTRLLMVNSIDNITEVFKYDPASYASENNLVDNNGKTFYVLDENITSLECLEEAPEKYFYSFIGIYEEEIISSTNVYKFTLSNIKHSAYSQETIKVSDYEICVTEK